MTSALAALVFALAARAAFAYRSTNQLTESKLDSEGRADRRSTNEFWGIAADQQERIWDDILADKDQCGKSLAPNDAITLMLNPRFFRVEAVAVGIISLYAAMFLRTTDFYSMPPNPLSALKLMSVAREIPILGRLIKWAKITEEPD
eukprot:Skav231979  [mRNA]  locus=scaffold1566:232174:235702:- [translate_table: standard]